MNEEGQSTPQPQPSESANPNPAPQETPSGTPAPQNSGEKPIEGIAGEVPNPLEEAAKEANKKPAEPQGAPEAYQPFKLEDGTEYAPEQVETFCKTAKELGLSQESAQKLFGSMEGTTKQLLAQNVQGYAKQWREEAQNDQEYGGANFKANLAVAGQAFNQYATPRLKQILNVSGLGNNPEVIRMFYRIGKGMQQDHGVVGNASAPAVPKKHYEKSQMVEDEGY